MTGYLCSALSRDLNQEEHDEGVEECYGSCYHGVDDRN